ncbi:MAG: stage III sporulation protein AF [Firmicutes bacterium]|nr:stage III sporulation protein AF [Bacillota bacterium]
MIAAISQWILHIVTLLLLGILLDAVLPQSGVRKYARVVISLLIVLALLAPVRALLSAAQYPERYAQRLSGPLAPTSAAVAGIADAEYRVDLARAVTLQVADETGIEPLSVQVETTPLADGGEQIANIDIALPPGASSQAHQVTLLVAATLGLSLTRIHVS